MNVNRKQAFSNFSWKLAEQIGAQMVSFVVSIILARLLMPDDYSVVSVISIISAFCAVFIDSGLSKALVQKKNTDLLDYSTVLVASLFFSFILYWILFFFAPYIAKLYGKNLLVPVIRVYSITLIIGAFNTVQCAYISKNLLFKKYFLATIVGTIVSAFVGISMAYTGYGPWALVAQQMTNSLIDTIILFLSSGFRPRFAFSVERIKNLWSYGIKVLGTSLLDMLYDKIRPLVVGIKFNTVDLAYYEKGSSYPGMINSTLSSTLASVLFPIIAAAQDNIAEVKLITQKYIRVSSFLIFPSLLGLASVANNLVLWMLTEKWMQAVPYMQIFCINYMFMLLQTGNLQAINAIGRSDIVLKLALIKKTINFILLFVVILVAPSPLWLAALGIITSLIAFLLNSFTNSKLLKYGLKEQVFDILPNLLSAILMACIVYLIGNIHLSLFPLLIVQIIAGILIYSGIAFLTHNSNLKYCLDTLRAVVKK